MQARGDELIEQRGELNRPGLVGAGEDEDVATGGSVTFSAWDAELAVSPEVMLLAVTVNSPTGWPVPV